MICDQVIGRLFLCSEVGPTLCGVIFLQFKLYILPRKISVKSEIDAISNIHSFAIFTGDRH